MNKNKSILIICICAIVGVLIGFALGVVSGLGQSNDVEIPQVVTPAGEVKTFRQPAIVYFYGENCSSCQKFKPNWNIIKRNYGKKFAILEIDVDKPENARFGYEFMVNVIPAVFIEDAEFRNRAYVNPAEYHFLPRFRDTLDRYLEMRKFLMKGAVQ